MEYFIGVCWFVFVVLFEISYGQKLWSICKYLVPNLEVLSRVFYVAVYVQSPQGIGKMDHLDFLLQSYFLFYVSREFKRGDDSDHQADYSWKLQCRKIRGRRGVDP